MCPKMRRAQADLRGIFIVEGLPACIKHELARILHDAGFRWCSGDSLIKSPIPEYTYHIDTSCDKSAIVYLSPSKPEANTQHLIIPINEVVDLTTLYKI